jgi:Family of unknown function (DUF5995)
MPIPASSIQEVILELDTIIQKSINENSKLGLFAALYKKVTEKVRNGIANNRFEDGSRMERLDVLFANRYLEAYKGHIEGRQITSAWQITFDAAQKDNILVLQHVLAGMNAHISLDLGIATAQVATGQPIANLEHDFNEINTLLGELIENVQDAISKSSPMMAGFDWLAGKLDEKLARFNLDLFRKRAWEIASNIHSLDETTQLRYIAELDNLVKQENSIFTGFGGVLLPVFIKMVARLQSRYTAEAIKTLNSI